MGTVVFLLAAHLASGSLIITALLALRNRLPDSFLRFCLAASALSAAVASILSSGEVALAYGAVAAVTFLAYWRVRRAGRSPLPPVGGGGAPASLALSP